MSSISDAIAGSFAARYDQEKQAVADVMKTDAKVNRETARKARLETIKMVKRELKEERESSNPDPDIINALVGLLADE